MIPPERSTEVAAAIHGATLVVLPDAGHLSPVEAPSAVADALRAWLAD